MTNEQLQEQIVILQRELNDLKNLFYKDNYSNLEVFRKKVEFKGNITIADIDDIVKTGGTAVIADGNTDIAIPDEGDTIRFATKNGLLTSITLI